MLRFAATASALALAVTLTSTPARAQIPLTVVAGPTIASVSTDAYDASSTVGFFVAAGTAYPLSERVSLMPFVGYVQKGAEFDGSKASYDYIEIPLFLGTRIALNEEWSLGLHAGPQVGFNINCDEDGYDCSDYEDFKGTEVGVVGGVALSHPLSESHTVSFGISYDLGLTDIFGSESDYSFKNRVLSLWAGIGSMIGG
jgi:hypothetical protein